MYKLLLSLILILALSACGITGHRPNDPGYADYKMPGWSESDRVMSISLGPAILGMAKWAVDADEEPELEALLDEVRAVRVAIYEMETDDSSRLQQRFGETTTHLQQEGWEVLVKVHDSDEGDDVLVMNRIKDNIMTGMVVLVLDEEELVFVNLMGNIDPARLGDILHALDDDTEADLDIDLPDDIGQEVEKETI